MAKNGKQGFSRIVSATGYTIQGIRAAWLHEEAFRQEMVGSVLLIPLGLYLANSRVEAALLVGSVMLLPIVELLNSAVEAAIDRIGSEQHELSGRAKDMGSAAVAFTMMLIAVVWLIILVP